MADKLLDDGVALTSKAMPEGVLEKTSEAIKDGKLSLDKKPPPTRLRHDPNRPIEEYMAEDENDRLRIAKHEFPEGFDLNWVTSSILGRAEPQYRARFERKGWVPILTTDFDGKFARFMPEGHQGEVEVDGLVLMARPMSFTRKAQELERREAVSRIQIKEQQLTGGEIDKVSLDARNPSALRYNRIGKSYETISVPDNQSK